MLKLYNMCVKLSEDIPEDDVSYDKVQKELASMRAVLDNRGIKYK